MAVFSYKAISKEGTIIKGKLSAVNEQDLESKLTQASLDLISASKVHSIGLSFFSSVRLHELIVICIHLHQLEKAGVPILDSISDLRDTSDSQAVKTVMMDIYDSLKNGKLLSVSMAQHPNVFDKVFVGLVAAGEKTGSFAEIFEHLEYHLKWIADIRSKIKKAMYYPIFLLFLMTTVIMVMMIFVIPKLTVFLVSQHIPLPLYTKALIATSDFVSRYWYFLIVVPILIYIFVKLGCYYFRGFAYQIDALKLKVPGMGTILRKLELARFCHFFSITYKSGMGVIECLEVAEDVVTNLVLKESVESVQTAVSEGTKLTEALKVSGEFPRLIIRMFSIGEESGNLDQALKNINDFYDQEVNDAINAFVVLLQPVLTIMMGGLLMWITISVFGPVYSSFGIKR